MTNNELEEIRRKAMVCATEVKLRRIAAIMPLSQLSLYYMFKINNSSDAHNVDDSVHIPKPIIMTTDGKKYIPAEYIVYASAKLVSEFTSYMEEFIKVADEFHCNIHDDENLLYDINFVKNELDACLKFIDDWTALRNYIVEKTGDNLPILETINEQDDKEQVRDACKAADE